MVLSVYTKIVLKNKIYVLYFQKLFFGSIFKSKNQRGLSFVVEFQKNIKIKQILMIK